MLDLETLGTSAGCVILSIGCVEFFPDKNTLGDGFYEVISTKSCEDHFLIIDPKTLAWWDTQSPDARVVLEQAATEGKPLTEVLINFNRWLANITAIKEMRMYGNGSDFDNPILRSAYDATGIKPYGFAYGGRCYRTLKSLDEQFGPSYKAPKLMRSGTRHNALDDAKSQARHLMEIIGLIRIANE